MKIPRAWFSRILIVPMALATVPGIALLTWGQEAQTLGGPAANQNTPAGHSSGVPWDWSHHHLIFSPPGTAEEALQKGTYDRWLKITDDPRYTIQQRKRSGAGPAFPTVPQPPPKEEEPGCGPEWPNEGDNNQAGEPMTEADFPGGVLPRGLARALIPPPAHRPQFPSAPPAGAACQHSGKIDNRFQKDWSETEGNNGTTGLGNYPATFTTTSASCTNDFAVYNTGLAGSSTQASIIAFKNLYSTCNSNNPPTTDWAYNTGGTIATSVVFSGDGTQLAMVQSVPYPVAASGTATADTGYIPTAGSTMTIGTTTYTWESTTDITAVNQMSISGITLESEIAQTFYAALTGNQANCPSSNSTCIASGQTANTSVTAEFAGEVVTVTATCNAGTCGNSVVFTQSSSATQMTLSPSTGTLSGGSGTAGVGGATLVLIRMAAGGSLSAPATPTHVSPSSYLGCTAPCMTSVQLSGSLISTTTGPSDTQSSPFYDYGDDVLYVGDDSGGLHKFTGVFNGTPAETTTGGWPVAVSPSQVGGLDSPVYDSASQKVFVGDLLLNTSSLCEPSANPSTASCGFLYSVNSSGTVTASTQLDFNMGIYDGPVVDSSAEMVYAFAGADNSTNCSSGPCAAVYQFPVGFGPSASGTKATVGAGYEFLSAGTFDNQYYTSSSGNLYVVGGTGPQNNTLYAVPITNNGTTMGTPTAGPEVATNYSNNYYAAGLPVTEFFNTSQDTDYLFLGVLAYGYQFSTNPCPSPSSTMGCIMGFTAPASGYVMSNDTPNGALQEAGGVSGIVVDNGASGASNIYFSTLANQTCTTSGVTGGCAVSATQAAP